MNADDLVDTTEIATRLDYAKSSVGSMITRDPSFPAPLKTFTSGTRVWWWPDVVAWHDGRGVQAAGWTVIDGVRVRTNTTGRARTV